MRDRFRLTMAQLNPTMGDLEGNAAKALEAWTAGRAAGADLVALPEMFLTGYQTQDLVLKDAFVADAMAKMEDLATQIIDGPALGIGGPWIEGERRYNAYWILKDGGVHAMQTKHFLPNYTVFDEVRLFNRGDIRGPYDIDGVRIGSPICEDAWFPDVAEAMVESGAEILVVPNGSPYFREKFPIRVQKMVSDLPLQVK